MVSQNAQLAEAYRSVASGETDEEWRARHETHVKPTNPNYKLILVIILVIGLIAIGAFVVTVVLDKDKTGGSGDGGFDTSLEERQCFIGEIRCTGVTSCKIHGEPSSAMARLPDNAGVCCLQACGDE